jgi:hypothetical protein
MVLERFSAQINSKNLILSVWHPGVRLAVENGGTEAFSCEWNVEWLMDLLKLSSFFLYLRVFGAAC